MRVELLSVLLIDWSASHPTYKARGFFFPRVSVSHWNHWLSSSYWHYTPTLAGAVFFNFLFSVIALADRFQLLRFHAWLWTFSLSAAFVRPIFSLPLCLICTNSPPPPSRDHSLPQPLSIPLPRSISRSICHLFHSCPDRPRPFRCDSLHDIQSYHPSLERSTPLPRQL